MSGKNFLTISKTECLKTYPVILNNSDDQWSSAEVLANAKKYGPATAHAIISIEELVKATLVFLDGKGFKFRRVKGMNVIFKNHEIRYLIAYIMFVLGVFGDELIKFMVDVKSGKVNAPALIANFKSSEPELMRKFKQYSLLKFRQIRTEFRWFSQVDIFRQDSLYCDYDEMLKSPLNVSQEDYHNLKKRLDKVRVVGKQLIEAMESSDPVYQDHIESMVKEFNANDYYGKMELALTGLRASKASPFEFFLNALTDLSSGQNKLPKDAHSGPKS